MYYLDQTLWFPSIESADADGLLAVGGDLTSERLMLAYRSGIFPWYEQGQPILWWSPDPRMVLFPSELKISKSLRRVVASRRFQVTFNQNFEQVISQCAVVPRKRQDGTWITPEMQQAYIALHQQGHAHSVEVWEGEALVGGLYGIALKERKVFCGESMFNHQSNASKVGFVAWVNHLISQKYDLIDCQMYTDHLARFGAREIPRHEFSRYLGL